MIKRLAPILVLLLSLGFLKEEIDANHRNSGFANHGEMATISPIVSYQKILSHDVISGEQNTGVSYKASVKFTTHSGEQITVPNVTLPPGVFDQSQRGERIDIEYLPENPQMIQFVQGGATVGGNLLLSIGGLLGAIAWCVAAYFPRKKTGNPKPARTGKSASTQSQMTLRSDFEILAIQCKVSGNYMPAYEKFANTRFYIGIIPAPPGEAADNYHFILGKSPEDNGPCVIVSETMDRFTQQKAKQYLHIMGSDLVRKLNPQVSILVALSDRGFGITTKTVNMLKVSMQPL